jgi:two-component system sensor histidine kinase DesK
MARSLIILLLVSLFKYEAFCQLPIDGLSLWLRADTGIQVNGSKVVKWLDQSGNNNHASVTPALTAPILISNELNGKPVVRFNGTDNGLQAGPLVTFPSKRGTFFIVFRINGLGKKAGAGYGSLLSTYFGKGLTWQFGESAEVYGFYDGEGTSFPFASCKEKKWEVAAAIRVNDTTFDFYRLGRFQTQFNVKDNQPDTNILKIGSSGRLEVLNGDIAEVIIYGRAISASEISDINSYLLNKYHIQPPPKSFTETSFFYLLWLLGTLLIVVLLTHFFSRRKLRKILQETEKERQLEQERQRISREMHDDIGAGLTQIVMMSESAKRNQSGQELDDISKTSRQLVSAMSEIIWSLDAGNKTLEQLNAYLREKLYKQLEYTDMAYSIQLAETSNSITLSNQQKRNIILITREAVNNAIKYSQATTINISSKVAGNNLLFTIEDNGVGFDASSILQGNGLKNMQHRVAELNGTFQIKSSEKGTACHYSIPLK